MTFIVQMPQVTGTKEIKVVADEVHIQDGCLVFKGLCAGQLGVVGAMSPGTWLTVKRVNS